MKKPWVAALGAFLGSSVAVLVISYRNDGEFNDGYALSLGIAMALGMYVIARWKEKKANEEP
jgi:hypothetical protein